MTITLDAAQAMIERARAHATSIDVPMNIAVTDGGGHLLASETRAGSGDQDVLHRASSPAAARATSPSWAGSPPETPIAPIRLPSASFSATPPA